MERLIEIYNKVNNYGRANGMQLTIKEAGHIEYVMQIKDHHLATPFAAHGGAVAGFMDGILGVAALSATAVENKLVSTIEFKINFLQPVYLNDTLKGIGKVVQKGKRIIIASGEIYNQQEQLVATALGTFNAYPFEKSGIEELIK